MTGGRRTRRTGHSRKRRTKSVMGFFGYALAYGVLAVLVTWGTASGYRFLRSSPRFALAAINVEGVSDQTSAEVMTELFPFQGVNIFELPLDEVRSVVLRHPRIADAAIRTDLPNGLTIRVEEHQPAGLIRVGNRIQVVDHQGRVILPLESYGMALDFPVLTGLDAKRPDDSRIQAGLGALAEIKDTSLLFWDNIETMNVADPENLVVQLRGESAPIHFGEQVIPANVGNYLAIAERIQAEFPTLAYIELGFPNQVAIKPIDNRK